MPNNALATFNNSHFAFEKDEGALFEKKIPPGKNISPEWKKSQQSTFLCKWLKKKIIARG